MRPETETELADLIRGAAEPLSIVGGATRLWPGEGQGRRLDLSALTGVTVLCISRDLPFAHSRFCGAEGIDGVQSLSTMRDEGFGERYGLTMTGGPLAGLLSRAVVVLNGDGEVVYTEQVPEIVQEPDYAAALAAV